MPRVLTLFAQSYPQINLNIDIDSTRIIAKTVVVQFFFVFLPQICILIPYKSGSLRRPHPTYPVGAFARTFLMLQKSRSCASFHMISAHARVQNSFRNKCKKPRLGVPPARFYNSCSYIVRMCVICKE